MKMFVYTSYSTCVIIFANSKYEALGYLESQFDENNSRKYYVDINEIVEIKDDSKNTSVHLIDVTEEIKKQKKE